MLQAEGVPVEEIHCDNSAEMERALVRILRRLQPIESRWVRLHGLYWLRTWLEPAALNGGPLHVEDVADFVFHVPSALSNDSSRAIGMG